MEKHYDITVIGSGPGGYIAAIRSAQLGFKTAIIEKYKSYGGTCLNVGCIPSKYLLEGSKFYYKIINESNPYGIKSDNTFIDLSTMDYNKNKLIQKMSNGINFLLKKHNIDIYNGIGSFIDDKTLKINKDTYSNTKIISKNTIIATGSKPRYIPSVNIDKKLIVTSAEALNIKQIYKDIVIIGGGAIGIELASIYARLGSKVTIIEYFDNILPSIDNDISNIMQSILIKNLDIKFIFKCNIEKAVSKGNHVEIVICNDKNQRIIINADYCIIAIGRSPYIKNLQIENINLKLDNNFIKVNKNYETNVKGIYAIGDVIGGNMLAHKSEMEGTLVAEIIHGNKPFFDYKNIPNIVYTWPEIAIIGISEKELKYQNHNYRKSISLFAHNGKANASNETNGQLKVLSDYQTDEILGVQIIGPNASDIISSAISAMTFSASSEDIKYMCFPHPTYSEIFRESCVNLNK
ncbi:MAG: dihydrolipoyl dehydrogenase [Bacteroides sp.]|nr:MAG: dihydrolipoyl dehydrogenase [Bacteroides sp.]